jgi:hypothetical protein
MIALGVQRVGFDDAPRQMIGNDEQRLALFVIDRGDIDEIGLVDRHDDLLSFWRPFRTDEDPDVRRRNLRSVRKCRNASGDDGRAALRNFGDSGLLSDEPQDRFNWPNSLLWRERMAVEPGAVNSVGLE